MPKLRSVGMGSVLAAALSAGLLGAAGPAQAASPGQLCQVGNPSGAPVSFTQAGGTGVYFLSFGAFFRIEAYNGNYYRGHGTNLPTGNILRSDINQGTCR